MLWRKWTSRTAILANSNGPTPNSRWSTQRCPGGGAATGTGSGRCSPPRTKQPCWTSAAAAATWPAAWPVGRPATACGWTSQPSTPTIVPSRLPGPSHPCPASPTGRPSAPSWSLKVPVFDVVISNHLLHHLTPAQFQGLLADSGALAMAAVIHSDIARSPVAYALFAAGTLPFFPGSFIRARRADLHQAQLHGRRTGRHRSPGLGWLRRAALPERAPLHAGPGGGSHA